MSSLEQHTSAEKPVAKLESINGQRGANVPQCAHRTITLKQRQLCVEKPREQRFYVGYCRSSCPSSKEAGSGGYGVGEGEGVCSKECKVNETAHRRMRRLRTEARWLCWRDVFAPPQSDPNHLRYRGLAYLAHRTARVGLVQIRFKYAKK